MSQMFKLLATDFVNQQLDDQLYPGKCSNMLLMKMPPFAIFVSEFDFLAKDGRALAKRGEKFRKLLDISDLPSAGHGLEGETSDN